MLTQMCDHKKEIKKMAKRRRLNSFSFGEQDSRDEWQVRRIKAVKKHIKRQNLKYKNVYLAEVANESEQTQLRFLKSKLNCCGLWYGTYHEGKAHAFAEVKS
jgi:hypothetical protein